jgi:hypothetical protein
MAGVSSQSAWLQSLEDVATGSLLFFSHSRLLQSVAASGSQGYVATIVVDMASSSMSLGEARTSMASGLSTAGVSSSPLAALAASVGSKYSVDPTSVYSLNTVVLAPSASPTFGSEPAAQSSAVTLNVSLLGGAIAGAVLAFILLIAIAVLCVVCNRAKDREEKDDDDLVLDPIPGSGTARYGMLPVTARDGASQQRRTSRVTVASVREADVEAAEDRNLAAFELVTGRGGETGAAVEPVAEPDDTISPHVELLTARGVPDSARVAPSDVDVGIVAASAAPAAGPTLTPAAAGAGGSSRRSSARADVGDAVRPTLTPAPAVPAAAPSLTPSEPVRGPGARPSISAADSARDTARLSTTVPPPE